MKPKTSELELDPPKKLQGRSKKTERRIPTSSKNDDSDTGENQIQPVSDTPPKSPTVNHDENEPVDSTSVSTTKKRVMDNDESGDLEPVTKIPKKDADQSEQGSVPSTAEDENKDPTGDYRSRFFYFSDPKIDNSSMNIHNHFIINESIIDYEISSQSSSCTSPSSPSSPASYLSSIESPKSDVSEEHLSITSSPFMSVSDSVATSDTEGGEDDQESSDKE